LEVRNWRIMANQDNDDDIAALLRAAFDDGPEDQPDDAFIAEARHRRRRHSLHEGSDRWMYSLSSQSSELEQQLFQAIMAVRNDDHTTFDLDESLKLLDKIRAQAVTYQVDTAIAAIEVETAKVLRHTGHLKESAAHGAHAVEISEREGLRRTFILAHFELGMLFSGNGDAATDQHYSAAEALVREGDVDLRARLMYGRARAARKRADLREAIRLVENSICLYERT